MICACFVCNLNFADLDVPIKWDSCNLQAHGKCSRLTASEQKFLFIKTRTLKYFSSSCEKGLRDIPELKQWINQLLTDVNELKIFKGANLPTSEDFIITY